MLKLSLPRSESELPVYSIMDSEILSPFYHERYHDAALLVRNALYETPMADYLFRYGGAAIVDLNSNIKQRQGNRELVLVGARNEFCSDTVLKGDEPFYEMTVNNQKECPAVYTKGINDRLGYSETRPYLYFATSFDYLETKRSQTLRTIETFATTAPLHKPKIAYLTFEEYQDDTEAEHRTGKSKHSTRGDQVRPFLRANDMVPQRTQAYGLDVGVYFEHYEMQRNIDRTRDMKDIITNIRSAGGNITAREAKAALEIFKNEQEICSFEPLPPTKTISTMKFDD